MMWFTNQYFLVNVDDDPDGYVMVNSERRLRKYNKKAYIDVDTEFVTF